MRKLCNPGRDITWRCRTRANTLSAGNVGRHDAHQTQNRWSVFSVRDVFLVKLWNLLGAWAVNRERAMSIISLQLFWSSAQECSDLLSLTSDSDTTMSHSSIPPVPYHYSNTWRKWSPPRKQGEPFGRFQYTHVYTHQVEYEWTLDPDTLEAQNRRCKEECTPRFCPGNRECELVKDDDGEEACCRCGVRQPVAKANGGGRWAGGSTTNRP